MKVTAKQGKRPYYSTMGWPVIRTRVISSPSTLFLLLVTRKQASQFKTIPTLSQTGPSPLLHKPLTRQAVQNITQLSSASSASSVTRVHLSFYLQPLHIQYTHLYLADHSLELYHSYGSSPPTQNAEPAPSSREGPQLHCFHFFPDTSQRSAPSSCQNSSRAPVSRMILLTTRSQLPTTCRVLLTKRGFPTLFQLAPALSSQASKLVWAQEERADTTSNVLGTWSAAREQGWKL